MVMTQTHHCPGLKELIATRGVTPDTGASTGVAFDSAAAVCLCGISECKQLISKI